MVRGKFHDAVDLNKGARSRGRKIAQKHQRSTTIFYCRYEVLLCVCLCFSKPNPPLMCVAKELYFHVIWPRRPVVSLGLKNRSICKKVTHTYGKKWWWIFDVVGLFCFRHHEQGCYGDHITATSAVKFQGSR